MNTGVPESVPQAPVQPTDFRSPRSLHSRRASLSAFVPYSRDGRHWAWSRVSGHLCALLAHLWALTGLLHLCLLGFPALTPQADNGASSLASDPGLVPGSSLRLPQALWSWASGRFLPTLRPFWQWAVPAWFAMWVLESRWIRPISSHSGFALTQAHDLLSPSSGFQASPSRGLAQGLKDGAVFSVIPLSLQA